eukprot:scaffold1802_cov138-Pinguiococcus_pyrenoidosus.AAC.2
MVKYSIAADGVSFSHCFRLSRISSRSARKVSVPSLSKQLKELQEYDVHRHCSRIRDSASVLSRVIQCAHKRGVNPSLSGPVMLGKSFPNQAFSCSWAESEHARYTLSACAVARTSPSAAMVAALILGIMAACFGVLREGEGEGAKLVFWRSTDFPT